LGLGEKVIHNEWGKGGQQPPGVEKRQKTALMRKTWKKRKKELSGGGARGCLRSRKKKAKKKFNLCDIRKNPQEKEKQVVENKRKNGKKGCTKKNGGKNRSSFKWINLEGGLKNLPKIYVFPEVRFTWETTRGRENKG